MTVLARRLGRSNLQVSALGLGCWAIGGAMAAGDQPLGYAGVDDAEAVRALHRAVELGVTLFDTADAYGAGHSERLLGSVLADHPEVLVATKFGNTIDEATRQLTGVDTSPAYVRRALAASLRRLGRERVDLYQLHTSDVTRERAHHLRTIPLPGFRNTTQVEENLGALAHGPLNSDQHAAVEDALGRETQATAFAR